METLLKICSVLLSYPEQELLDALPQVRQVLAETPRLGDTARAALNELIDMLGANDIYAAQENYVLLFDRTRALSLHLFEHVHGESRDRGQAMVDLKEMYADAGFEIDTRELPDYLPMFLEFASTQDNEEAKVLLGDTGHLLMRLKERLAERQSPYAGVFAALLAEAGPVDLSIPDVFIDPDELDDPNDLEALDRVWEEEVVQFGGNAGEGVCGPDRLRTQVRAAQRPAAPNTTAREA